MKAKHFDNLTKCLANSRSRRETLGLLASFFLGSLAGITVSSCNSESSDTEPNQNNHLETHNEEATASLQSEAESNSDYSGLLNYFIGAEYSFQSRNAFAYKNDDQILAQFVVTQLVGTTNHNLALGNVAKLVFMKIEDSNNAYATLSDKDDNLIAGYYYGESGNLIRLRSDGLWVGNKSSQDETARTRIIESADSLTNEMSLAAVRNFASITDCISCSENCNKVKLALSTDCSLAVTAICMVIATELSLPKIPYEVLRSLYLKAFGLPSSEKNYVLSTLLSACDSLTLATCKNQPDIDCSVNGSICDVHCDENVCISRGHLLCGGECVTAIDDKRCGSCGNICADSEFCDGNQCAEAWCTNGLDKRACPDPNYYNGVACCPGGAAQWKCCYSARGTWAGCCPASPGIKCCLPANGGLGAGCCLPIACNQVHTWIC
jgi:hypothetical protein